MILPKNSKDVPALRNYLTTLRTQACSAAEGFSAPLKEMASELVKKLDGFIADLPKDDVPGDWSLESKLDSLFALLAQASALASMAGLELSKLKADGATQLASAVTTEISRRITAGELVAKDAHEAAVGNAVKIQTDSGALVAKDTVTQLCAEARNTGFKEGEKKVRDEIAAGETRRSQIAARKEALQQAGLPVPEAEFEAVLAGTDAEFEAVKTRYTTRLEGLKKNGIQLAAGPLLSKLFMPDVEYAVFEKTVSSIDAFKTPPAEVLATPGAETKGGKGGKPFIV